MLHTVTARVLAAAAGAAALLALSGCDENMRIHDTTLDNGLRVIVQEDHRAPVVVSMVMYKVGSIDEPKGITGISHVLEHMMFQGTERLKPNEFSRIIAEQGGRENAFTSYDYTGYFQMLEKSRLPISFELEADRMANLRLREEEFKKEVQVVMEERRLRTEDRPESLVYERLTREAYRVHPYSQPIIGSFEDLRSITLEDLRDWYHLFYRPNNAVVVVVGDVDNGEVVALAKKYFGPIPGRDLTRPPIPSEPLQKEMRQTVVRVPAQVPYLLMGYHVPVHEQPAAIAADMEPWEPYALMVLAGVLDGGQSARLERELVREKRIAASVSADYDPIARDPTLMLFSGVPATGHTTAELEQALRAQIERLKKEVPTEAELDRVKAQVVAGDVFQRDSMYYQAMQLGQLAMTGLDLNRLAERVERLNAVTAEQVRTVANKYLKDTNLTVTTLDPLPIAPDKAPAAPEPGPQGAVHAR